MKSLILVLLLFSSTAHSEHIFDCMEPVNLDDPSFEQGSERYFDIYFDEEQGVKVVLTRGDLKTETMFQAGAEKLAKLTTWAGSFFAQWENPKVSLVIKNFGKRYRGSFWFSEGLKTDLMNIKAGREIELSCIGKGPLELP